MSNEISPAEQGSAIVSYEASDGSNVKLTPEIVARYIVTGGQQVDDREIMSFMAKCQARHLNPLAGDAYMTAYYNKRTGRTETSVIVSKDYFVRTATQQPGFDGMQAGVVVADKQTGQLTYRVGSIVSGNEELVGGWAEVYDKNRSHPSRAEVSMSEYNQHRSLWNSKPGTMIRKTALVQALREAYPGAFGGIYDSSEMPDKSQPQQPVQVQATVEQQPQQVDLDPIRAAFKDYCEARGGIDADTATEELCYYAGVQRMSDLTQEQADDVLKAMQSTVETYRSMQQQQQQQQARQQQQPAEPDVAEDDYEF